MRTRATVAVVTGALALSAFAVPAAQAAGSAPSPADKGDLVAAAQAAREAASGTSAFGTFAAADTGVPYALDLSFSGVKVNNGKPIVAGTTNHVTVPVTYNVTHSADIDLNAADLWMDVEIYRGDYADPTNLLFGDDWPTCTATTSTTATCKGTIDVYPDIELTNADATTWKVGGYAIDWNDQDPLAEDIDWSKVGYIDNDALGTTKLQRFSKLTVNASPEPVVKGKTITVSGKLTRANWDTGTYTGLPSGQSVVLQFRKAGTTNYTNVKGIKTASGGALKTTVTAATDGYFRFTYAGIASTAPAKATGDFVDVK